MKNQYFADTRDLFKYDLVIELISKNRLLKNITFFPLLTKNDLSRQGSKIDYSKAKAGTANKPLVKFLLDCLNKNKRDLNEINNFFKDYDFNRKISFASYKSEKYLENSKRNSYFDEVTLPLLSDAVILLDPDTGIETNSTQNKSNKHVTYAEILAIYKKMNKNAVLLIFQFIPRVDRKMYFNKCGIKLKNRVSPKNPVLFVSDSHVVFFLLTKTKQMDKISREIIKTYSDRYGLIEGIIRNNR